MQDGGRDGHEAEAVEVPAGMFSAHAPRATRVLAALPRHWKAATELTTNIIHKLYKNCTMGPVIHRREHSLLVVEDVVRRRARGPFVARGAGLVDAPLRRASSSEIVCCPKPVEPRQLWQQNMLICSTF